MMEKNHNCERCGRAIGHRGRCLPCNVLYKHKRYFFSLRENPEYDSNHGLDPKLARTLIEDYNLKVQLKKQKET